MDKSLKSIKLGTLVLVISLLVAAVGVSFAFFVVTPKINSSKEDRTAVVTTDYLDFDFATSEHIDNSNLILLTSDEIAEKSEKCIFTVSKKPGKTRDLRIEIVLTDLTISDNMKSQDFKWDLLKDDVSIYSGNFLTAATGEEFIITTDPILLNTDSATYELRVWLEETDQDQNGLFNGTFQAKVGVNAYLYAE